MDTPISFNELWNKKKTRLVGEIPVNIVCVEDLIELKKYANRKQDLDDIILLSKLIKK
jgi:predicted nucleotidyltransferase